MQLLGYLAFCHHSTIFQNTKDIYLADNIRKGPTEEVAKEYCLRERCIQDKTENAKDDGRENSNTIGSSKI